MPSTRIQERTLFLSKGQWCGEDRLFIQCPYRARLTAKGLPHARWEGAQAKWHVPFTGASWAAFIRAFPPFSEDVTGWHWMVDDEVWVLPDEAKKWESAQDAKSGADFPDIPTKTVAAVHQRRCFAFASGLKSAGLFVEMGGGKSAIAIGLLEEWDAKRVLVLCPKSVIGVWPKQLDIHSPRQWRVWTGDMGGVVKRKAQDLWFWLGDKSRASQPSVAIMNYDISWRPGMESVLLQQKWDVIILDESHKIKSAGGKASRYCGRLTQRAERVLLLTGTPTPHGPADLYGQYRAADPNIFGNNFDRFKREFFNLQPIAKHVDKVVGFRSDDAETSFTSKMASISIVVKREDMTPIGDFDPGKRWSLPPVERQVRLGAATWLTYQELKIELVTEIEAGTISADNALVKLIRLRQITSGFTKTDEGLEVDLGLEKRALLAEVLEDIPAHEPIVIFGIFHNDLDSIRRVANEAGRPYLELSGRERTALAPDSTLAVIGCEVVGVQLQSGGVGVDFTRAAYGCDYSIDYNLGNIEQSRARLDRPGQSRAITWIHLVAIGPTGQTTVDGLTYDALAKRAAINNAVLDALRRV